MNFDEAVHELEELLPGQKQIFSPLFRFPGLTHNGERLAELNDKSLFALDANGLQKVNPSSMVPSAAGRAIAARMSRHILHESKIHPAIQERVAGYHQALVEEVEQQVASNDVVVIGMKGNPHCKKARKLLAAANMDFVYLEYGSYLGEWRRRSALKMWSGWPTFPMVFHKGVLVGGADDLEALLSAKALS